MIDFLICYEHVNREVENDALIKYELDAPQADTCEIIPFSGPGFARFCREKARVVVTPWLRYDENVFHYLQMAGKPSKLVQSSVGTGLLGFRHPQWFSGHIRLFALS